MFRSFIMFKDFVIMVVINKIRNSNYKHYSKDMYFKDKYSKNMFMELLITTITIITIITIIFIKSF